MVIHVCMRVIRNWMSKNIDASVSSLSTVSCRVRHSDCAQYVCNIPTEF
jgi:hypothetical protein